MSTGPPPLDAPPEDDTTGRVPPQDLAAEMAVLGSMMLSRDAVTDCEAILTPADFYRPSHETIHAAILTLHGRREPVDVITVADELTRAGNALMRVGGHVYLHQLVDAVTTAANAAYHAAIVADRAVQRALVAAGTRIVQMGYLDAGGGDVEDMLATAEAEVGDVAKRRHRVSARPIADSLLRTVETLEGQMPFAPTGWPDLDRSIYGWRPGALHIVAARPGAGKSIFGLQSALRTARGGASAVYAVMEMDDDEVNVRLLAQAGTVGLDSLSRHRLSDMEWGRVAEAVTSLHDVPLYVDDSPHQSIAHIRAHAREVARQGRLGMIVVDYVQQVQPPAHMLRSPRHEQVAHTSRELKLLARELDVPVLAMCQVNRGPESRADKRPTMADLRESGAIEADADVVLILHREHRDHPTVEVIVEKARHGRQASLTLAWQAHFARLMSDAGQGERQDGRWSA